MTMTIDISPTAKAKLEAEAAKFGQEPQFYLQAAIENTFLSDAEAAQIETGWDALTALIEACQHDHYRLGTSKRED